VLALWPANLNRRTTSGLTQMPMVRPASLCPFYDNGTGVLHFASNGDIAVRAREELRSMYQECEVSLLVAPTYSLAA